VAMPLFRRRGKERQPEVVVDPAGWIRRSVLINLDPVRLPGDLAVPPGAPAVVVFAHGSGSSRRSPRNVAVARRLNEEGLGTLLFDLLTAEEGEDRSRVFDIELLARRLETTGRWVRRWPGLQDRQLAFFGASTGAAAALVAAASMPSEVGAVVSRGGRPDLAGGALERVAAPTLLIVGGDDVEVLELNRDAQRRLRCPTRLEVIPGATHLFEEPGALERVAELAASWASEGAREALGRVAGSG
ncbi:MAG TPA: dienelactone hydrolase family protein, partial [Actinomycetota bacterium]|nr:dienelactone hydrolase family protein [Actinomycetota bacterium]